MRAHRAEVLTALLTLGRNWFASGRPMPDEVPRMGSFEAWSTTLAGVLHAASVPGFMANASALYERASEHVGLWTAFIEVLYDLIDQPDGNTATELAEKIHARENADLREVLPDTLRLDDENLNIRIIPLVLRAPARVRRASGDTLTTLTTKEADTAEEVWQKIEEERRRAEEENSA